MNSIWLGKEMSKQRKYNVYQKIVESIVMYSAERGDVEERFGDMDKERFGDRCAAKLLQNVEAGQYGYERIRELLGNEEKINDNLIS